MADAADVRDGGAVSRRDVLKLASGVAALAAALGVPAGPLAALTRGAPPRTAYQLKFYRRPGDLLQTIDVLPEVAAELDAGRGPNGVALHRIGDAVDFAFPLSMAHAKLDRIDGTVGPGARYEVRFYTARRSQTATLNDDVACLLDRDGQHVEMRLFQGTESVRLELPAGMLRMKCR